MDDYVSELILSRPHPRLAILNAFLGTISKRVWSDIYAYAFEKSEHFPAETLRRIQERRLMRLICRAKKSVPFYAKHLRNVHTLQDFQKLPPLTKRDIRKAFEENLMVNRGLEKFYVRRYTSGSSGVPFVFYHDSNSYIRRIAVYGRLLRWAGLKKEEGDIAVWIMRGNIHPEAGAISFTAAGPEEIEAKKEKLYALLEGKGVVLHAMASHLIFLADLFERDRKSFRLKSAISYGETLYPQVRQYLERKFRTRIFDYYASQEIMNQANECEMHDGMHASSEWAYIEILGKSNEPLPPGESGSVVVTAFDNEVMPFIRYGLGDTGYWMKEPCPCGRTLPRIKLEGRSINHYLVLPNGAVGDFISLANPILRMIPKVVEFQIIRYTRFEFTVRVVPTREFDLACQNKILDEMQLYLGPEAMLYLESIDKIPLGPGGKPRVFINLQNDSPAYQ